METVRFIKGVAGDRDCVIHALIELRVSRTIVVSVFNTLRNRGYLVRNAKSEFILIQMPDVILEDICYEVLKTKRYVSQKPRVIYR